MYFGGSSDTAFINVINHATQIDSRPPVGMLNTNTINCTNAVEDAEQRGLDSGISMPLRYAPQKFPHTKDVNLEKNYLGDISYSDISNYDGDALKSSRLHMEKKFVDTYFTTIDNIHPMISKAEFLIRCNQFRWKDSRTSIGPNQFNAFYYAVVACGALFGEDNEEMSSEHSLAYGEEYFMKARATLQDVFEEASLDLMQTLFVMVFNQHTSIQPLISV